MTTRQSGGFTVRPQVSNATLTHTVATIETRLHHLDRYNGNLILLEGDEGQLFHIDQTSGRINVVSKFPLSTMSPRQAMDFGAALIAIAQWTESQAPKS